MRASDSHAFSGLGMDRSSEPPGKEQFLLYAAECPGFLGCHGSSPFPTASDWYCCLSSGWKWTSEALGNLFYTLASWAPGHPCMTSQTALWMTWICDSSSDPVLLSSALIGLSCLVCLISSRTDSFLPVWNVTYFTTNWDEYKLKNHSITDHPEMLSVFLDFHSPLIA